MRFFRGISVSHAIADQTIEEIRSSGLLENKSTWKMSYSHPGPIEHLFAKIDLSCQDTVNGGLKMYRRGGAKVSHGLGGSLSR